MKRFTRIVALILALVMLCSFPVSADDYADSTSFNVLEYSFPDGGTTSIDSASPSVFELPFDPYSIKYIDMLVYCPSAPTFTLNGSTLTSSYLGNWIYRVYGRLSAYVGSSFSLEWSGPAYVEYYSVRISTVQSYNFVETGTMEVSGGGLESNFNQTMSSSTSSITCSYPKGLESNWYSTVKFYSTDWRLYDYVDFYFHIFSTEINSIDCFVNNRSIPFEVTEIYDDSDFTSVYCSVRMDLRNIDRLSYYTPIVSISLLPSNTSANSTSYVTLLAATGSIVTDPPDPNMLYFGSLEKHLSVLFASMAQRQDAYHSDLEDWQQAHDKLLTDQFASVNQRLSGISSAIVSMMNTLKVSIDTACINVVDKLTTFQSSMENYLDQLPARIAEEIAKIFKPTEGKFEAAKDESQELAEEKLGAVYQSAVVIDQIAGAFTVQTPQTSIVIPLVSVEVLPGVPFEFGGWDVPIVPVGLEFLIDTLKYVIDIVCTLAFLNGMKRRLDGFFGGESGVD